MLNVYLHGPAWFLGLDSTLEAAAALIAFFVAFAAYRLYRVSEERKYFYFSSSFGLLTLCFLSRAIADSLFDGIFRVASDKLVSIIFFFGYALHILFAILAYAILSAISLKISDKKILALILLLLIPNILSQSYFVSFYTLSFIFLAMIALGYYYNYRKLSTLPSFLVFISFLLLALAQVQFILSALRHFIPIREILYVSAQFTVWIGFMAILTALLRIKLKPISRSSKRSP